MTLDIPRIQAICFDVDGTLRDTDDQFVQHLARILFPIRAFLPGRDPVRSARRLVMGLESPATAVQTLSDRLQVDGLLAGLGHRLAQLRKNKPSAPQPPISGVSEMLAALSSRYPLAVVSARPERSTRAFLAEHNLLPYFHIIVGGQTCRRTKPHPDPVRFAARHLGVHPQNCLMIGDTTVDMRAGRAAGAQAVGVLCGFGEKDELYRSGADLILETTSDILNILPV